MILFLTLKLKLHVLFSILLLFNICLEVSIVSCWTVKIFHASWPFIFVSFRLTLLWETGKFLQLLLVSFYSNELLLFVLTVFPYISYLDGGWASSWCCVNHSCYALTFSVCCVGQDLLTDIDGQELSLKLHNEGNLGSYKGASGK